MIRAGIKVGDVMAITHYVKVRGMTDDVLDVKDLDNSVDHMYVRGSPLIDRMTSADRYTKEVKVTKTEAAEKLVHSYGKPICVAFTKANGAKRVLRGRLQRPEPLLGRSYVEDLDLDPKEHRQRLVDHRTILFLIVDDVRFNVE